MIYHIITFTNTHSAMLAKSWFAGKADCLIMPTPREISHSCGISLRFETAGPEELKDMMAASPVDPSMYAVYYVDDSSRPALLARLPL